MNPALLSISLNPPLKKGGVKAIFVTGTDTGVGKTIVTGLLARFLLEKGYAVITQKWIQTQDGDFSSDIKIHLKIIGKEKSYIKDFISVVSPYVFKAPLSPHKASQLENKRINPDKIKNSFRLLSGKFEFVIVEGIGGVLVPFNKKQLVIDIVKDLGLPVLIVAQNKLGAINHTLLTIEALAVRKIKILGIVFNNVKRENRIILEDNPRIVRILSKQIIFGVLPWVDDHRRLYKRFIPIGKRICRKLLYG